MDQKIITKQNVKEEISIRINGTNKIVIFCNKGEVNY